MRNDCDGLMNILFAYGGTMISPVPRWSLLASAGIRKISDGYDANNVKTYAGLSQTFTTLLVRFRFNVLLGTTRTRSDVFCTCGSPTKSRQHILLECRLLARQRAAVVRLLPAADRTNLAKALQGGQFQNARTRHAYLEALETFPGKAWSLLTRQASHLRQSRLMRSRSGYGDGDVDDDDSSYAEDHNFVIDVTEDDPRIIFEQARQPDQSATLAIPVADVAQSPSQVDPLNWQIDITRDRATSSSDASFPAQQQGSEEEIGLTYGSDDPNNWLIDLASDSSRSEREHRLRTATPLAPPDRSHPAIHDEDLSHVSETSAGRERAVRIPSASDRGADEDEDLIAESEALAEIEFIDLTLTSFPSEEGAEEDDDAVIWDD